MKILSFVYTAVAYVNPNSEPKLKAFKNIALKVSRSFFIGLANLSVIVGIMAYTNRVQAGIYYGSTGSDVKKLQAALGGIPVDGIFGSQTLAKLKSYQDKQGLAVDGIAGSATLFTLGLSSLPQKRHRQPEQYGRLKLINDTPYRAIITLNEPGKKQAFKYAYIPPCSQRTLDNTYSSSWKVSFNGQEKYSIGKFFDEEMFQVPTTKLNSFKEIQTCKYNLRRAKEILDITDSKLLLQLFPGMPRIAQDYQDVIIQSKKFLSTQAEKDSFIKGVDKIQEFFKDNIDSFINDISSMGYEKFFKSSAVSQMLSDDLDNRKLAQILVSTTQSSGNDIDEDKIEYLANWIADLRIKYKLSKERGEEESTFRKYMEEEFQKLKVDCAQLWGSFQLIQNISSVSAQVILSFKESNVLFDKISRLFDKLRSNTSQNLPGIQDSQIPKQKASKKTLELECTPVLNR